MEFLGHVENGVVVFDGPVALPEGAAVRVTLRAKPVIRVAKHQKRVEFPLVPSTAPASVHLTNEMIAEILDEEDAPP
jgi:predicted nuclease with RNAse H fold